MATIFRQNKLLQIAGIITATFLISGCVSLPSSFYSSSHPSILENTSKDALFSLNKNHEIDAQLVDNWPIIADKITEEIAGKITNKSVYIKPLADIDNTEFNQAISTLLTTKLLKKNVQIFKTPESINNSTNINIKKILSAKLNSQELAMIDQSTKPHTLEISTQVVELGESIKVLIAVEIYKDNELIHKASTDFNESITNINYYKKFGKNYRVVSK